VNNFLLTDCGYRAASGSGAVGPVALVPAGRPHHDFSSGTALCLHC